MNGKDEFIFFILLLLVLGAGYYYTMTESIFLRMDQLQTADKKHVDKVLGAYADSLDRYNLRFVGRGKHMRKMQKDISSNTDLIEKNTDSLASMIEEKRTTPANNGINVFFKYFIIYLRYILKIIVYTNSNCSWCSVST